MTNSRRHLDWEEKISAYIDGELPPDQMIKVEEHIALCNSCRDFADKLRKIKGVTEKMKLADLPDLQWRKYNSQIYNRVERSIGWIIFTIGAVILLAFGGFQAFRAFFTDPEVPIMIKIGSGVIGIGLLILLVSVIRETIFRHRHERYKEVDI